MSAGQKSGAGTALERITALVAARTGASLSQAQIGRLSAEVVRRLSTTGRLRPGEPLKESDVERYLSSLRDAAGAAELGLLLASIAVHKTDLFRDAGQLEAFRSHVLEPRVAELRDPLRLWSAGCATGEEVATLLLMLAAVGAPAASTVLGTDLSERALAQAKRLTFRTEMLRRIPVENLGAHVVRDGETFTLSASLRRQASFSVHNLMDAPYPLPSEGAYDVIFCRNVLIYFTPAALEVVVERLARSLRPGGTLVLSAAEPLLDEHPMLDTIRLETAFFYRRRADPRAQRPSHLPTPAPVAAQLGTPPPLFPSTRTPAPFGAQTHALQPLEFSGDGAWTARPTPAPLAPFTSETEARDELEVRLRKNTEALRAALRQGRTPAPLQALPATIALATRAAPANRAKAPASKPEPTAPLLTPGSPTHVDDAAHEAQRRFEELLEASAAGAPPEETERSLRQCLYLDPHFAQARYLLAMLIEQRGDRADAANEYRRALAALRDGSDRFHAFFLNRDRLQQACVRALTRIGFPAETETPA